MPLLIEMPDLDAIAARINLVRTTDMTPLMDQWVDILIEGNRRGVLSGRDGNDQAAPPLRYRFGIGKRTRNRRVPAFGTTTADATGFGPFATGLHDNLSTAAYQQLDGPRLAPRGENSRIIKNLFGEIRHPSEDRWEAVAVWDQVVSEDGELFLPRHFDGIGRLPRYDLRPVRPRDVQFCINALQAFAKAVFFEGI